MDTRKVIGRSQLLPPFAVPALIMDYLIKHRCIQSALLSPFKMNRRWCEIQYFLCNTRCSTQKHLGNIKRIWYLSPMRAAKVLASVHNRAVSPEPALLAYTSSDQEEPSDRKPDPWHLWMAGYAQLKFFMTECTKTQICLTRPICRCRERQHNKSFG